MGSISFSSSKQIESSKLEKKKVAINKTSDESGGESDG